MQTYQLIVFLLFITSSLSDDWTSTCPPKCVCKWTNGKKSVICNGKQLTQIPTVLSTEVQVLVLNENSITYLNREEFNLLGLNNLQRIYLKRSNVMYIHRDTFKNLRILVELDLSDNAIETIDKYTFNGNDRLRILYLNGNPLKHLIAYQFPVLPHLRSLDLHQCQLLQIDPLAFANLELLELLNLKDNQLEHLSEHVFMYMKTLKTLSLEVNPWRCDCRLRKFHKWYIQTTFNNVSPLTCAHPMAVRTKQWDSIDETQFGCGPIVEVFNDEIYYADIGSNITFNCWIYGDPLPTVTWDFNGREFENENVQFEEEEMDGGTKMWKNVTIFNITNNDAGIYVCQAKNNIGTASRNTSIVLTEAVQHVIDKGPETFWYFGLILGTFGTVFVLIILSFMVCVCKKSAQRRRTMKNIKGSVSFNDQEKKLLDLSITTNDRQDSCELASSSTATTIAATTVHHPATLLGKSSEPIIHLEPVQITIENISRNDEFPLNVGVFPPPPEFRANVDAYTNPTYGNIFISVSLATATDSDLLHQRHKQQQQQQQQQQHQQTHHIHQQHTNTHHQQQKYHQQQQQSSRTGSEMFPDLLNIPNRVIGKLFPINVSSYATLPRNRRKSQQCGASKKPQCDTIDGSTGSHLDDEPDDSMEDPTNNCIRLQNVINYQNLETNHLTDSLCAGCLNLGTTMGQPVGGGTITTTTTNIDDPIERYSKYDNMGRRITASGHSTLSLPDEDDEHQLYHHQHNHHQQHPSIALKVQQPQHASTAMSIPMVTGTTVTTTTASTNSSLSNTLLAPLSESNCNDYVSL